MHFEFEGRCVQDCKDPDLYANTTSGTCRRCAECTGGCVGPTNDTQCIEDVTTTATTTTTTEQSEATTSNFGLWVIGIGFVMVIGIAISFVVWAKCKHRTAPVTHHDRSEWTRTVHASK